MITRLATASIAVLATLLFAGFALAQDAPLVIVTDIVAGHENAAEGTTCTPMNRFAHEQQVVWRTKVIDPMTGEPMAADELESVMVVLPDGQEFEMEFGSHPPSEPVDEYWTVDWVVPMGYPTGIIDYAVEVVGNDGRAGIFVNFPLDSSMLTIIE